MLFMGWVAIYLTQNLLVATGRIGLHRKLGWVAAAWMLAMIVSGFVVTTAMVRAGSTVPFFFQPLHFLIFDPGAVLTFGALTAAAIMLRRRTEWHRRLHFCGMTMLLAPAFGRLLPLPLMQPWAWEAIFAVTPLFHSRACGRTFDAAAAATRPGTWGIAAIIGSFVLTRVVTYSPAGMAI